MKKVSQGDVWWADLAEPRGSVAGYRRPVVIIQSDQINVSRLPTYLCAPLTGKLYWQNAPWNLFVRAQSTGLPMDSIVQTNLVVAVDEEYLLEWVGKISERALQQVFERLDLVLGRSSL